MQLRNDLKNYGSITKILHWSTALLILAHIPLGWWMQNLPLGLEKIWYYNLHKSLGLILLFLIIIRIVWRQISPPSPPLPNTMSNREKNIARAMHISLYTAVLAQPIIGIFHSWASGYPIVFFNSYTLPSVRMLNKSFADWLSTSHFILGWGIAALIVVHISAALKHHYLNKDLVLIRMLPFCRTRN
ncbi:cytochrome b [Kiloniella antarctica]|uniref:Cytochrome b n=1 Tax=Kiloniella antarctica TaxID=1550907 RepID=A0ABW5BE87_9PROT